MENNKERYVIYFDDGVHNYIDHITKKTIKTMLDNLEDEFPIMSSESFAKAIIKIFEIATKENLEEALRSFYIKGGVSSSVSKMYRQVMREIVLDNVNDMGRNCLFVLDKIAKGEYGKT